MSCVTARRRITIRVTKRTAGVRYAPRCRVTGTRRIVTYIGGTAVGAIVPLGRRNGSVIGYCVGTADKHRTGITAAVCYMGPREAYITAVVSVTVRAVLASVKVSAVLCRKRSEVRRVLSARRYTRSIFPVVAFVTVQRRRRAPLG